ncbi:MAG: hypothetical protein OEV42_13845 [Deltaproteobacteria bacterium]|nr:hypothetical protein [Deltaproteobacteria bacterium]
MKKINDIAVILFARLNSQRIPEKMIKPFAGTTLIDIAVEKIMKSRVIPKENIYLYVYEQELIDIGNKYGINILERSEKSANAESSIQDIHEWHKSLNYKYVVTFNACTPLLKISTIDNFITHYTKSSYDGLFGVIEKRNFFWDREGNLFTSAPLDEQAPNTKTAEKVYEAAHCLYASKTAWIKDDIWLGRFQEPNDPELYVVDEYESFDIDYLWQFELAQGAYIREIKKTRL